MNIFFATALTLLIFSTKTYAQWSLNDVSYLIPLSRSQITSEILPLNDNLPMNLINKFPRLTPRFTQEEVLKKMTVVSIRIEPQKNRIRLVWQPVFLYNTGPSTLDVALHSHHELSVENYTEFLVDLRKLKNNTTSYSQFDALDNNPIFTHENNSKTFLNLIKSSLKKAKLVELTAMALRGADNMWVFMGLKINSLDQFDPIQIPRTQNSQVQRFVNQAIPFKFFDSSEIAPIDYNLKDNLELFIAKATRNPTLTEIEAREALGIATKFENPRIFNTDNLDCVSCHIAQSSREWISVNHKQALTEPNPSLYENKNHNLENKSDEILNTGQIRGFGYFGANKAISQRVIHDSAEAADYLNMRQSKFTQISFK